VKEGAAPAATTTTTTAAATATAHMNGGESGESSSRVRVLVVDDSLTILRMVSRVLEGQGFVVETAKNGQEALQKMVRAHEIASAASYRSDAAAARTGKLSSSTTAGASTSRAFAGILCADTKTSAAASAIEELTYDVVLMDIQMPVMGECTLSNPLLFSWPLFV
jgi:CheY-like chemotaxis protein